MRYRLLIKSLILPVLLQLASLSPASSAEIKLSVGPKGVVIDEGDVGTYTLVLRGLRLKDPVTGKDRNVDAKFAPGDDKLSGTATYTGGSVEGKIGIKVAPQDHTIQLSFDQLPPEATTFAVGMQFDAGQFQGGKFCMKGDKLEEIPLDVMKQANGLADKFDLVGRDGVGIRIKGPSGWQAFYDERNGGREAYTYFWTYSTNLTEKTKATSMVFTVEELNIPSAAVAPASFKSGPPADGNWEPIPELTDEFEGSSLDKNKWNDTYGPTWLGRQPSWFSADCVTVKDGKLQLVAQEENPPPGLPSQGFHTFAVGCVVSKIPVLYGYFETKAKPMGLNVDNGFWFTNSGFADEQSPKREMDVFEISGRGRYDRVLFNTMHHWKSPAEDNYWSKAFHWRAAAPLAADYHVYAMDWEKDEIKCYIDGYLFAKYPNTCWNAPLRMVFDNEVSPGWFGIPSKNDLPATFSIEYVRAWRRVDGAAKAAKPSQ